MFKRPVKEINAEFLTGERIVENIQQTVRESCVAAKMPRKDISAVLLAIEEGVTNITRHAFLYEKGVIRLKVVIYEKKIVFSLFDSGRSFDAVGSRALDLEHLVESGRKGGLGFYLIRKIMDSVEYISVGGLNELRMIKRIKKAPPDRPFLRRLSTLRVRFSVWTFIVLLVIIGCSILYFDFQTSKSFYDHLDDTVQSLSETIADQAAGYLLNQRSHVEFDRLILSNLRANPELRLIVLTDGSGLVLANSSDVLSISKPFKLPKSIDLTLVGQPQPYSFDDDDVKYLITPILTGSRRVGTVHTVYSTDVILARLTEARRQIVLPTVLLLIFGIIAIYLLSNYFVRPIADITHRVRRFTSGDLETELPLEGAEEFFEISRAFNQMMTRLSRDRTNIIAREKMAKEMEVAAQIQKTLLPTELPHLPGLEIEAIYRPAMTVSGDLYDVFEVADGRFCLAIADVSGKGVPASLVMSMVRTVIQVFAHEAESPHSVLIRANEYLLKSIPPGMFITVLLAIYETASRRLKFVSAGHNPMLLFKNSTGEVTSLNPGGMPLGVPSTVKNSFEETLIETALTLDEEDSIFIFTDGISEAVSPDGERFGMERLTASFSAQMKNGHGRKLVHLSEEILREVDRFTGFSPPGDDISFILARRTTVKEMPETNRTKQEEKLEVRKIRNTPAED